MRPETPIRAEHGYVLRLGATRKMIKSVHAALIRCSTTLDGTG